MKDPRPALDELAFVPLRRIPGGTRLELALLPVPRLLPAGLATPSASTLAAMSLATLILSVPSSTRLGEILLPADVVRTVDVTPNSTSWLASRPSRVGPP